MTYSSHWFCNSHYAYKYYVPFLTFPCFSVASTKYILIEENKSWREAQEYCRTFHTDLANVRTCAKNNVSDVWIGLFKDFWSWSDQSNISFRFWNFSLLKPMDRHHNCTVVMVNQTGRWNDVQCNITLPFICHGGVFITFSSGAFKSTQMVTDYF